jgi:hypothetical protein
MAERKTTKKVETPEVSVTNAVHGIALAAMIVGIIAVVFCWLPLWGFVISAVALALGIVGLVRRAPNHGMALAGTILGGVGILLNILFIVAFVGLAIFSANSDNGYRDTQPDYYYNY